MTQQQTPQYPQTNKDQVQPSPNAPSQPGITEKKDEADQLNFPTKASDIPGTNTNITEKKDEADQLNFPTKASDVPDTGQPLATPKQPPS